MHSPIRRWISYLALPALLLGVTPALVGSSAAEPEPPTLSDRLSRVSSVVALRAMLADPSSAPEALRPQLAALRAVQRSGLSGRAGTPGARPVSPFDRFNDDFLGLPQNEESVAACVSRPGVVLGGTNDYRGFFERDQNITGWHFSQDGGATLANEGRLPPVDVRGAQRPSSGDPVDAIGSGCSLYAASLNLNPFDPFRSSNGVGVYRSTVQRLSSCGGGSDPMCWPTRRSVVTNSRGHFLDKEWLAVGRSGRAGEVVWVTYTDFDFTDPASESSQISAVRCDSSLSTCTAPILVSGTDRLVQFSDVTIGADGRTYVTWSELAGGQAAPPSFVHKLRVAQPGSTAFGPTRVVTRETRAIPFGGKLNANDFRIATYAKNSVAMVNGRPRVFVTWDACSVRAFDFICEDAQVKLAWSDDLGRTWSGPTVLSVRGHNYFPTISADPHRNRLVLAYYTSRYDLAFDNRQDVELLTLDPARPAHAVRRQRVTSPSNEPEADPVLGGFFIGDYFEAAAVDGKAYVHYNANYVRVPFLEEGRAIPQQDNFLAVRRQ